MELVGLDETDPVLNYLLNFKDPDWRILKVERIFRETHRELIVIHGQRVDGRYTRWEYSYKKLEREVKQAMMATKSITHR